MLYKNLKLKQVSESLERIRMAEIPNSPKEGWLKSIRTALGMSMQIAASKTGINTSTWEKIEKREQKWTVTIETLQNAANALNCDVKVIMIPRESLNQIIEREAVKKADQEIRELDATMSLEKQENSETFFEDMKKSIVKNYIDNPKSLWQ